jgi:hypothetical protein
MCPATPGCAGALPGLRRMTHLGHAAGHEAADRDSRGAFHRPHHGPAGAVRLGDHGLIGHHDPLSLQTDPVMPILRLPIRIGHRDAIGIRAARPKFALQAIEPGFEWRVGIASIIAGQQGSRWNDEENCQDRGELSGSKSELNLCEPCPCRDKTPVPNFDKPGTPDEVPCMDLNWDRSPQEWLAGWLFFERSSRSFLFI